jgi:hypothetical protein
VAVTLQMMTLYIVHSLILLIIAQSAKRKRKHPNEMFSLSQGHQEETKVLYTI